MLYEVITQRFQFPWVAALEALGAARFHLGDIGRNSPQRAEGERQEQRLGQRQDNSGGAQRAQQAQPERTGLLLEVCRVDLHDHGERFDAAALQLPADAVTIVV